MAKSRSSKPVESSFNASLDRVIDVCAKRSTKIAVKVPKAPKLPFKTGREVSR